MRFTTSSRDSQGSGRGTRLSRTSLAADRHPHHVTPLQREHDVTRPFLPDKAEEILGGTAGVATAARDSAGCEAPSPVVGARTRKDKRKSGVRDKKSSRFLEQLTEEEDWGLLGVLGQHGFPGQSDTAEGMSERGRWNVWPSLEADGKIPGDVRNLYPVHQASGWLGVSPPARSTSRNAMHEYYDASRQPLHVSQQTSPSAVRDMGLPKGLPVTIHETHSETALPTRPLKSAMKKPGSAGSPEAQRKQQRPVILSSSTRSASGDGPKKSRKLDLSQFFPQSRSSSRSNLLSPHSAAARSLPRLSANLSDFGDQETVKIQLRRPSANAPFETQKMVLRPVPSEPRRPPRPKVFEPDIFDQTKTNVRRPPKGIQNWFDGFDISSDEEEATAKHPGPAVQPPQELPAIDLPSTFSPWQVKPDSEQPRPHHRRKLSKDPMEDSLLAIEHARERMSERMRATPEQQHVPDYASSTGTGRRQESRLAIAELSTESVLSLSDSSGDEGTAFSGIDAGSRADSLAKLPLKSRLKRTSTVESRAAARQSTSTVWTTQTSGSIPIRLTASIPLPDMPLSPPAAAGTESKRSTASFNDPTKIALRKLTGQDASPRSRPTTKISVASAGETSASSMPTDASHVMAVTEEEMLLLEMMRNKRAAMQKNSFTEGYQLALKREQEHIVRRRESAQAAAVKTLRRGPDKEVARSHRGSRIAESIVEIPDPAGSDVEYDQRRKYSAIRKEEVDKALKLSRYLSTIGTTPTVESFPEPPSRTNSDLESMSNQQAQKFELLLPDTYCETPSKRLQVPSPVSADGSSPPPEEEDIEDHHHQVRQFLASSHSAATQSVASSADAGPRASSFPAPPPLRSRTEHRREGGRKSGAPSPVREEEGDAEDDAEDDAADFSASSPLSQLDAGRKDRRSSAVLISGRHLSPCQREGQRSPIPVRSSVVPTPPRPSNNNNNNSSNTTLPGTDSDTISSLPDFNFTPLEFPIASSGLTASPSIATTSGASPLTPTFTPAQPNRPSSTSGEETGGKGTGSDSVSPRVMMRAYTPDTDFTSPTASSSGGMALGAATPVIKTQRSMPAMSAYVGHVNHKLSGATPRQNKRVPPRLENLKHKYGARQGSITSITSAGEDVLAAWAALGGEVGGLAGGRRIK